MKTADALASLGHDVFEVSLSVPDPDAFVEGFGLIWNTGSAGIAGRGLESRRAAQPALHEAGKAVDSIAYVEAVRQTQLLARPLMAQFVDTFDVLLTPTMATLAPRCGSVWEGADVDPMIALLNCFPMACSRRSSTSPACPPSRFRWITTPSPACRRVSRSSPVRGATTSPSKSPPNSESALPWKDRRPPLS